MKETALPIILKQSPRWSRAILWTMMSFITFGITWSYFATIEQTITVTGKLKPQDKVQEIQAPVGGVVKVIHVKEGSQVKPGEVLISFDSTTDQAELDTLENTRDSLQEETNFYNTLIKNNLSLTAGEIRASNLPPEVVKLALHRTTLIAENQVLRSQINKNKPNKDWNNDQVRQWYSNKSYLDSIATAQDLETEQKKQLQIQNKIELENTRKQLITEENILQEINQQNRIAIATAQDSLTLEKEILTNLEPLVEEGAVSQVYYQRQAQAVKQNYKLFEEEKYQGRIRSEEQLQKIKNIRTEIAKLITEGKRLELETLQSNEELISSTSASEKEIWEKVANNNQKIANIDSQISKNIIENKKLLAEISGKITRTKQELQYQQLKASSLGTVFDLQANNQEVVQPGETVMKIVPDSGLIANVFIPNKDIGFVKKGMTVNVRIDTFSFSEFGDIKGELVSIGSDALLPNKNYPFSRFPARIKLTKQAINHKGKKLSLQSGMSISGNIVIDTERKVISLFVDFFDNKIDALKRTR